MKPGRLALWMLMLVVVAVSARSRCVGQAPAPSRDVLIFTNGDRLTGSLVRGVNDTVIFHSDMAGEITVPLAKVKELRTSGEFAVLRHGVPVKESQAVQPVKNAVSSAGVVLSPERNASAPPVAVKDVAYIVDGSTFQRELQRRAGPLDGWTGTVNVGATLVQSTQHGGTISGGVALVRQVPVLTYFRARNKTVVNLQAAYGTLTTPVVPQTTPASADSVVKTNIIHADAERDQYFSRRLYTLVDSSFDHNFAQGLQLQQVYGAGFGYTPFQTPVQQLDLKAETHYERQQFIAGSANQQLIGSTFAENYRRVLPRKFVLTEALDVLPAWNQLNAYSANGSVGLTLPLLKRLSVNLTSTDNYLNNPSPGYCKNSFQFVTGVTYALK